MSKQPRELESEPLEEPSGTIVPHRPLSRGAPVLREYSLHNAALEADSGIDGAPSPINLLPTLLRAKWLILCVFVLVSGAALPLIRWKVLPEYQATALVQVSPVIDTIVYRIAEKEEPYYTQYLNTQVFTILSQRVLHRVLERKDVRQTTWYTASSSSTVADRSPPDVAALNEALSVAPVQNTQLISVTMTALDPEAARVIADGVVDEYMKISEEVLLEGDGELVAILTKEFRMLREKFQGLVNRRSELRKKFWSADSTELLLLYSAKLFELQMEHDARKRDATIMMQQLQTRRAEIEARADDGDTAAIETQEDRRYAGDPDWRRLDRELERRRQDLNIALEQYGEAHPRIIHLKGDVDLLQEFQRQRQHQLDSEWLRRRGQSILASDGAPTRLDPAPLELQAKEFEYELELRQQEIQQLQKQIADLGNLSIEEALVEEAIQEERKLLDSVRGRLTKLQMESKAPARITILSPAIQPTSPFQDRRLRLTIAALGGALMLGMAIAVLLSRINPKVVDSDDIRSAVGGPFLGQLPELPSEIDLKLGGGPLVTEAVRIIRTALLERLRGTDKCAILITSASSQSGKTTVAFLLAASLASLGKRVLLVEADLRRPSLSHRLHLVSKVGLAAVLTGEGDDEQAVISTGIPGLDVLLAGEQPAEFDPERLANGVFTSCLKRWKKQHDFILVDSPPLLPVADARILCGQVDGTIMVLRASHSRRAEVIPAYADLTAAGGVLLGAVLVGAHAGSQGQYYDAYEYHPKPDRPHALKADT